MDVFGCTVELVFDSTAGAHRRPVSRRILANARRRCHLAIAWTLVLRLVVPMNRWYTSVAVRRKVPFCPFFTSMPSGPSVPSPPSFRIHRGGRHLPRGDHVTVGVPEVRKPRSPRFEGEAGRPLLQGRYRGTGGNGCPTGTGPDPKHTWGGDRAWRRSRVRDSTA